VQEVLRGRNVEEALMDYAKEAVQLVGELISLGVDPVKAILEEVVQTYAEVLDWDQRVSDAIYSEGNSLLEESMNVLLALYMRYYELLKKCTNACPDEVLEKAYRLSIMELEALLALLKEDVNALREVFNELCRFWTSDS